MGTEMKISLPTDSEGFVSQECPDCYRKFKVQFVEENGESSPKSLSFCPYCGFKGKDCFWTREQADYFEKMVMSKVVGPELDKMARELDGSSGGLLKIEASTSYPKHAVAPKETEDLRKYQFNCCDETIKILENWDSNLFCIICGTEVEFNGWE